jgi:hypothetical protein
VEEAEAQCRLLAAERDDLLKRDAEAEAHRKHSNQEIKDLKVLHEKAEAQLARLAKECDSMRCTCMYIYIYIYRSICGIVDICSEDT